MPCALLDGESGWPSERDKDKDVGKLDCDLYLPPVLDLEYYELELDLKLECAPKDIDLDLDRATDLGTDFEDCTVDCNLDDVYRE